MRHAYPTIPLPKLGDWLRYTNYAGTMCVALVIGILDALDEPWNVNLKVWHPEGEERTLFKVGPLDRYISPVAGWWWP